LDAGISSWEQKFRDRDFLLRGKALTEARLWATKKPADLSPLELEFIEASGRDETAQMRSRRLVRVGAALTVSLFAWAVLGWWIWTYSNQYQIQQILSDAPVTAAASTGEDGTSAGIAWVKALRVAGKAGKADEALQAVLAGARQIRPLPAEASSPPAESQASVAPPGPAEFAQQYKKRQQATGRNSTPAVPAPVPSPVRRPKASPAPVDAQKPMALAMVAEELPPASASEVLSEARDLAGRVSLPRARAYVLSFMGTIYEKKGMPADAIQAFQSALSSASEVQDSYARAAILRDIAVDMAGSGLIDEALTRVVSQQDGEARTITLVSMASTLVKARKQPLVQKLVDQAAQSAEAIKDPFSKVRALCDVAVLMAQEKMNGANKLFQGAQDAAVLIRSPNLKASALKFISSALSSAGVNDLALKTFQEGSAIDRKSGNADAGGGKQEVLLLARASQSDDALAIMKVLVSRDSVGADVIPIVQELCTSGRCQQALAAVSGSMTDANFAGSFCSAAPGFADADKATAKAVLSFVESAGPNLHDVANRSYCLNSLGQGWLQVGENGRAKADFNEASKLAGGILNPNYKSTALSGAAQGLAAVHEYRQARLNSAPCSAVDQLRAYTAILTAYAAQ
jgi:tetratricopeptide (TPR) repeat protein